MTALNSEIDSLYNKLQVQFTKLESSLSSSNAKKTAARAHLQALSFTRKTEGSLFIALQVTSFFTGNDVLHQAAKSCSTIRSFWIVSGGSSSAIFCFELRKQLANFKAARLSAGKDTEFIEMDLQCIQDHTNDSTLDDPTLIVSSTRHTPMLNTILKALTGHGFICQRIYPLFVSQNLLPISYKPRSEAPPINTNIKPTKGLIKRLGVTA